MDKYLNTGVKNVIREFPRVGEILEEYGIGCVPCTAGTCLLKDVVEIHRLAPEAQAQMLARIAATIYPDRPIDVPAPVAGVEKGTFSFSPAGKRIVEQRDGKSRVSPFPPPIRYSPPMQKLVNEHVVIKRWLALIPEIADQLATKWDELRPVLEQGIDFIRNYADAYHHAKEEKILFTGLDAQMDIIATMLQEHDQARRLVRSLIQGIEASDAPGVAAGLKEYAELLQAHIKKEDEILYPWIDRGLSDTQVGQLFSRFGDVDREFGDAPARYEGFVGEIEQRLSSLTLR